MPPGSSPGGDPIYRGVRVLELATGIAGPYATMFLADNGAEVVKVEEPAGDPYRADPGFQTINRNKRSVVVDDTTRDRLVAAADVIVVDRPGQAPSLRAANPGAVIVTMPPWGERGPRVDEPSSPSLIHAAAGIAWNQQSYAEVPIDIVVPVAHYGAGLLGALAAATGLLVRGASGVGPTYEASVVAGAAAIQLGEFRPQGPPPVRPGDSEMGSKGRVPCYRLVEAGDGRWFFLACGTARFYTRMLDVIGRSDLLEHPALPNPPWGLLTDEGIATLTPILDEAFAARPRDEWLRLLAEADVPAQPVLTREEFLTTPTVAANAMDVTVEHPELGPVQMMGLPVVVEGGPGSIRHPAPLLGADTATVTDDWLGDQVAPDTGGSGPDVGQHPLAGVRVIDLASFIAGPVVSRHLAMLGAEVIKVEAPTGDPFRAIGPPFESWNQGKRSIALDLTEEGDRARLHRLAATADVVVENFRPGVAQRLGVDEATLRAVNPDLVFLSSPGYGLDTSMADRPAFDPLVQALGGIMAAQGGLTVDEDGTTNGAEPVFLSVPIHDVATPLLGALGVVMALHHRAATGRGQLVRTSLVQSTMAVQAAEYTRFAGRPPARLGGFDHAGRPEDTWHEPADASPDPVWRDDLGADGAEVPVCRVGLTGSPLAEANELVTDCDHELGPLVVYGQLIGGAGPAPGPAPGLNDHGDALRAELDDLQDDDHVHDHDRETR